MLPPNITEGGQAGSPYRYQHTNTTVLAGSGAGGSHAAQLKTYFGRLLNIKQMDWDYTFSQMMYLVVHPGNVYTLSQYRHRTKNQWARDDPAFLLVLTFFILVSSIAYGVAFSATTFADVLILSFYGLVSFIGSGMAIATLCWHVANSHMRVNDPHGAEQTVEWLYAFDIHCNAFFTMFLVTRVLQYLMLPFLLHQSFLACVVANTLHTFGAICYTYITHLGYRSMSFLDRTQLFLYPIGIVLFLWFLTVLLKLNMTRIFLWVYFG